MDTDEATGPEVEDSPALRALLDWRRGLLASGVAVNSLPPESDLRRISQSPHRQSFRRLGLIRPDAVKTFQPGILSALRAATTEEPPEPPTEAPPEPPTEPVADTEPARPQVSSRRSRATADTAKQAETAPTVDPPPALAPPDARHQPADFAPREAGAPPPVPSVKLRALTVVEGGTLSIRWDGIDDGPNCVLYRVVTSDRFMPQSPEAGEVITVTGGTDATDRRPFVAALRYVQIWVNRGGTEDSARRGQPELLCQRAVVAPVHNVDLRDDNGSVTCSWEPVPDAITRVDVLRVPDSARHRRDYQSEYLITAGKQCRTGFQDLDCEPGETYEYRIFTVAEVDGQETTTMVSRLLTVSATLDPVEDLRSTPWGGDPASAVDLSYTPPRRGLVQIYRTEAGPEPGADQHPIPASALGSARLPAEARLIQPVDTNGGRSAHIHAVPWPHGWTNTYFTPVTVADGQARIGRTHTLTRIGAIHDARLVQLVDCQLLTLGWPAGATNVQVFVTARGAPLGDPPGAPKAELSRSVYESQGGLRLRKVLPATGCDVHIVPAGFNGGIVRGPGVTLTYGGLVALRYRFTRNSSLKDRLLGRKVARVLEITSDQPMVSTPRLVLVHNDRRLPLDANDGAQILIVQGSTSVGHWTSVQRLPAAADKPGFLRLFADLNPEYIIDFAVLDPPIDTLRGGQ